MVEGLDIYKMRQILYTARQAVQIPIKPDSQGELLDHKTYQSDKLTRQQDIQFLLSGRKSEYLDRIQKTRLTV